jgi:hypothetical protein
MVGKDPLGRRGRKDTIGESEPRRIRTADPLVKSQLLYRLSYRPSELE